MNLLGHNYIAFKTLNRISPYTFVGSHIPDFVPFLPSSIFSFEEIHENHEGFLKYIRKTYSNLEDLPLSMMCHSVKYGADEYNKLIDTWLLEDNEELTFEICSMIVDASGISFDVARGPRLHNYLWCGIDMYLIKNNKPFVQELANAFNNINYSEIAKVVSEYYKKNHDKVFKNLHSHFKNIYPATFIAELEYTKFWSNFLSKLPEGDMLNVAKGLKLLDYIYSIFEDKWEEILIKMEDNVKKKMAVFLKN